jgi:hypothetical protein
MAAAGKWKMYHLAGKRVGDGTFDFDANTFKIALFLSTSNCNTLTHSILGDLTNQHANANGYLTGGVTVAATWVQSGAVTTFDTADAAWTAAGGSITARFAVCYASGTLNGLVNPLVGVCLLDTAPADVTATDTNTFTVQMNASGLLTFTVPVID